MTRQLTTKVDLRMTHAGARAAFLEAKEKYTPVFPQFTMRVGSTASKEDHAWLGDTPGLEEHQGQVREETLMAYEYTLRNKLYTRTIALPVTLIEDDQNGQVGIKVKQFTYTGMKSYDRHAVAVIEENGVCYDGQNMFDASHPIGDTGSTFSNLFTDKALNVANAKTVLDTMADYVDDFGEQLGEEATHIMVPTALRWKAMEMFDPKTVKASTDPSDTVLSGAVEVIVNPYLTGSTVNSAYYMMNLGGYVKPFIFQERKSIDLIALDHPTDNSVFEREEARWKLRARFAFGYGEPRKAIKAYQS